MDRFWFHQCIHGLLAVSSSTLKDVRSFAFDHPYQQNIRMAEISWASVDTSTAPVMNGALHLPDRKALFYRRSAEKDPSLEFSLTDSREDDHLALAPMQIAHQQDQPQELAPQRLHRMLPVYVRPEPETSIADDEQEEHWAQLEQLLNEDLLEDTGDEDAIVASGGPPPSGEEPERKPLLDRLDLRIDDHAFGHAEPGGSLPLAGFTQWLSGLTSTPGDPLDPSEIVPSTTKDKDRGKEKKKEKKARKKAKRLAKLSVKRKKVVATQTLAELLAKQGHMSEAIDMFERLCLLYPEKKAIFAARIETIKSSLP